MLRGIKRLDVLGNLTNKFLRAYTILTPTRDQRSRLLIRERL